MLHLTHFEAGSLLAAVGKSMMEFDLCAEAALDNDGQNEIAAMMTQDGITHGRAVQIVSEDHVLEEAITVINL